jgi:DNA invertase Pin-like site-specific DNA recombinase
MSQLLLSIMGAVADFERSLILERQREGIAIAKNKGVYKERQEAFLNSRTGERATRQDCVFHRKATTCSN